MARLVKGFPDLDSPVQPFQVAIPAMRPELVALEARIDEASAEAVTFAATGVLTVRTGVSRWYNDTGRTLTITAVRVAVGTAPTGAAVIVDLFKGGVSIYTTQANRPTVAPGGFTQKAVLPNVLTVNNGEYLTVDIKQIGSAVAGSDLTLTVWLAE